jgi:3-isopropylmalate/(R)-2-methylmalate dehydratase small subunit
MERISVFTGVAAPLKRSNVDTDQIIPAVYLKRITKTGFEDGTFCQLAPGSRVCTEQCTI